MNAKQRLVQRLKAIVAKAESQNQTPSLEAELALELQAASGWWVNHVEDKALGANTRQLEVELE